MPAGEFLQLLLYILRRAVLPAAAAAAAGLAVCLVLRRVRGKETFPIRRIVLMLLFLGYLGGMIAVTVTVRTTGSGVIQWQLLRGFREAWNTFNLQNWLNLLLNIAMFLPLGILLPLLADVFRRWYVTVPVGFGISLAIEIVQYCFGRGTADVDDLLCNTLGAAVGYCLCVAGLSLVERRPRRAAGSLVLPVLFAAGLAAVFAAYQMKPYGNLPDAPVFAADTSGVEWVLECELSGEREAVGIYYAQPFEREDALAFAREFTRRQGKNIADIYDYDDNILFQDPTGGKGFSLMVCLADRACTYEDYAVTEETYGELGETALRQALAEFGIELPEKASFTYEGEGWHTVQADRLTDGETMTDGLVRCRVTADGRIRTLENSLAVCTRQGEEPILSEREAYERLCRGAFSQAETFEYYAPDRVRVLSCTLEYRTDTKGFRQPVYVFELDGFGNVFVPALR